MASTRTISPSGSALVDGVLAGIRWADPSITFSFPTNAAQYGTYTTGELATFATATAAMRTAARTILDNYAAVSGLNFTEETTNLGDATIRIAFSDAAAQTAYAYYPTAYYQGQGGDVWFSYNQAFNGPNTYANPQLGNYAWHTMLHELGHALGLKHGQDTSGVFNPLPTAFDSTEYSVMTYRSYVGAPLSGYTNETWGFSQTLMMADIAAIQYMYGANFSGPSDQVYTWSPTTGEMFINGVGQGAPGGNRIFATVWDGGGNATYDLSNYTTDLLLDLTPGSYSVFDTTQLAHLGNGNYASGNIYNALQYNGDARSLIANGIGGTGDDTIIGNEADNTLTGNAGADILAGHDGADQLYGGPGNDVLRYHAGIDRLDGGPGNDSADFSAFSSAVWVDLTYDNFDAWTKDGDDLLEGTWRKIADLSDIENISGSEHDDKLYGDDAANILRPGDGNDYVLGRGGNDRFVYTGGVDKYNGGAGMDVIDFSQHEFAVWVDLNYANFEAWTRDANHLASGTWRRLVDLTNDSVENIVGSDGDDRLYGNGDDNTISGGRGRDYIEGRAGDDRLVYEGGIDYFDGGTGEDIADFSGFSSAVWIDLQYTAFEAWTKDSDDLVLGSWRALVNFRDGTIEHLVGTSKSDKLYGNGLDNVLAGGPGDDYLNGRGGNDTFVYTDGLDSWDGGAGNDTADFSGFAFAVWIDLTYSNYEAWTRDGPDLNSGTWRKLANFADATIEDVRGTQLADRIAGNSEANTIYGGGGADSLSGGSGADLFVIDELPTTDITTIHDFSGAGGEGDTLGFYAADFGTATGPLPDQQLIAYGAIPAPPIPVLLYDTADGLLYFDPDGNGPIESTPIVHLVGAPVLNAADVVLL